MSSDDEASPVEGDVRFLFGDCSCGEQFSFTGSMLCPACRSTAVFWYENKYPERKRVCGRCGEKRVPFGTDWPFWKDGICICVKCMNESNAELRREP